MKLPDLEQVSKAKSLFKKGQLVSSRLVRPEIFASWKRSLDYGIDVENVASPVISPKGIQRKIEENRTMCKAAFYYLDNMAEFIKDSEFIIMLADKNGYILYSRGGEQVMEKARKKNLICGACRSEQSFGTNGIGTVLAIQQPLQVFAQEHYAEKSIDWCCSGAPIFHADGSLSGCICIAGMVEMVNDHTLGMVVATADAITRQLQLQATFDSLNKVYENLNLIFDTVPSATCLLDQDLNIIAYNANLSKLLNTGARNLRGESLLSLLDSSLTPDDFALCLANQPVTIEINQRKQTLSLSIQATNTKEYVVQIEAFSSLSKRVNNLLGNDAYFSFSDIVHASTVMDDTIRVARIAAQSESAVLLSGESGTGKELFAHAIHNASSRHAGPFVAVNCGAIPKSLVESELFGYESGAFTGAKKGGCAGKFELADGGTIFLDEIGDMPFDVQVTLLRVLQSFEVYRIGSAKPVKVDVRVITATNKDLPQMVADKRFREDLFYRLNVFNIQIPPLRERPDDVPVLAAYFLERYCARVPQKGLLSFHAQSLALMEQYSWPGNVRQLENVVERSVAFAAGSIITPEDLPSDLQAAALQIGKSAAMTTQDSPRKTPLEAPSEHTQIEEALRYTRGNVAAAAKHLHMSRRTIYRRIGQYQIDCNQFRFKGADA